MLQLSLRFFPKSCYLSPSLLVYCGSASTGGAYFDGPNGNGLRFGVLVPPMGVQYAPENADCMETAIITGIKPDCRTGEDNEKDNDREHCVRLAIGNGLRPDVWKEFLNRFGDIRIIEFYAATEGNIGFVNYTNTLGAVGRINSLYKKIVPHTLIKYDVEKDEPVRDANGFCVEVPKGEPGLLVAKISVLSPFTGYAGDQAQTEKKRLHNVFKKGDLYFNSGDLLVFDHNNFAYFHDRVGDTFRWKGENVATTEVADILGMVDFIREVNVYGVPVPKHEGRIGMATIRLHEGKEFDGQKLYKHVTECLPNYARPRFLRLQDELEITATFKQRKVTLVAEGFDPSAIKDPLYFLDESERVYLPMTQSIYESIKEGKIKL